MTYREAATRTLKKRGPMHYRDLTAAIMADGSVKTSGATPAATLNAIVAVDIRRKGRDSAFIRIRPGVFGLRGLHEPAAQVTPAPTSTPTDLDAADDKPSDDANLQVRIPLFPVYPELRHLLRVWPGYPRKQVTSLWCYHQRTARHAPEDGRLDRSLHLDPAAAPGRRPRTRPGHLGQVEACRKPPAHLRPLAARAAVRPPSGRWRWHPPGHEDQPGLLGAAGR